MTRKERILVVLFSVGITALVLLGIWSLRVPEVPEVLLPPGEIDGPPATGERPDIPPHEDNLPPDRTDPEIKIDITPEVPDGGNIEGKVVDEQGQPVLNATITAMLSRRAVRYAFTSEDGRYVIKGIAPAYYDIRADKENYAVANRDNIQVVKLQTTPNIDFELVRGGIFTGSVVDNDEKPVPGANVTLYATGLTDRPSGRVRSFRAKTNPGGEFEIENVPPGDYRALAQHQAYTPSQRVPFTISSGSPVTHKFILELGGSITGVVTDLEDNPVAEAQVWLSSAEDKIVFSHGARTDAEGRYALMGLQSGTANIRVLAPGFVTTTRHNITIVQGRATDGVDFRLDPGKSISGVVVNSLGEPVKGATVSGSDTVSYKTAKSGKNGEFSMSGFSGDKINLSVRAQGYVLLVRREVPAGTEDLQLILGRGGAVEGQAVCDVPLKSFVVVLYSIPKAGSQRRIVKQKISNDPEGYFRAEDIPEGTYTLEVHSKDYIQVSPLTVDIREGTAVSGLQVPMRVR